ncbi:MAG: carbonic anhydrase [Promethearchaeota archaeon]|nr:MAG: carbonic anhydrase [Candidatus Lokiarchaeota archaeon]
MNLKKELIDGNFKYHWKLIKEQEKIRIGDKIPRYPILILTCMDPRIDIHRIFQLEPDDVFVLRNAGNLITNDMLRSILITIHEYNIKYIVILGHLDCGMTRIDIADLKTRLSSKSLEFICRSGFNPLIELRNFFKPFIDELENVKNQIEILKKFQGIPSDIEITGMIYDVETGWVFEYNILKDLKFIENFGKNYRNILYEKRLQFVDFIEAHENQIVNSGGLIEKSGDGVKIEGNDGIEVQNLLTHEKVNDTPNNQKLEENDQVLFEFPNVKVPKIILPKITIHIPKITIYTPKIYRKDKQESF